MKMGDIVRGAAWMVLFRMADRSLGVISTLILARLLVPADFGLVAMANSVIAVIELVTAFSFEIALIQKAEPERKHYDTAWTLNLLLGSACALSVALLAYPTAWFYGEPRLPPVMLILAAASLVGNFENVGTVDFRRKMDFRREFKFLALKRIAGFAVTVIAAFLLRSYWALLAGVVTGRIAGVVLSYAMQAYRPRLALSAFRELIVFSRWVLFNNSILVAIVRVPHFVIGRLHGPQALGVYLMGSELGELTVSELAAPVTRAALPGYSRLTDNRESLKATFLDIGSIVLLFALPAAVGISVISDPLVRVLLGEKWLDVVPVLRLLAIAGVLIAAVSNSGSACVALGMPAMAAWFSAVRLVVLIVAVAALAPQRGTVGVAWAELLASAACLAASNLIAFRLLKLSWNEYVSRNWRLVVASLAMWWAVRILIDWTGPSSNAARAIRQLLLGVPAGAAVYVLVLLALWHLSGRPRGAESQVLSRTSTYARRLRDSLRIR